MALRVVDTSNHVSGCAAALCRRFSATDQPSQFCGNRGDVANSPMARCDKKPAISTSWLRAALLVPPNFRTSSAGGRRGEAHLRLSPEFNKLPIVGYTSSRFAIFHRKAI